MNTPETKPLTRKQKKWRRYRQYLKKKKLEKYGSVYEYDSDDYDSHELINPRMSYHLDYCGLDRIAEQIFSEENSETHKQKMYNELDKFIAEKTPSDNICQFGISSTYLYNGKILYNEMKNVPNPKYEIFGWNGCGYTCFVLYKSKDQKMYIIEVRIQTPTNYIKIENENIFGYWIIS